MSVAHAPLLLDYDAAAAMLSLSRAALRDLVYRNRGPRTVKLGRRTLFAVKDLEAFVDLNRQPERPVMSAQVLAPPGKRRRGRPTILEQMARAAAFQQ